MTRDETLVVDGDPTVVYAPEARNRYVPFAAFGVLRHMVLDICADIREKIRERVEIDAEEIEI